MKLNKITSLLLFFFICTLLSLPISNIVAEQDLNYIGLKGSTITQKLFQGFNKAYNRFTQEETAYISGTLNTISGLFGVVYFLSWGCCYVPQMYMNWKRKRVDGMSLDYTFQNEFGFLCYLIYSVVQYIMQEYYGANKAVESSDVAFAAISFATGGVVFIQCFIYPRGNQKPSIILKIWLGGIFLFIIISFILALFGIVPWVTTIVQLSDELSKESLSPLEQFTNSFTFIAALGYVKSAIVAVKYIPQILLNYKRKATTGMAIGFYYLDLNGAIASTIESGINTYNYQSNEFFFGNIPKLIILVVTYIYDLIVIFQHHVLYRKNNKKILKALATNS